MTHDHSVTRPLEAVGRLTLALGLAALCACSGGDAATAPALSALGALTVRLTTPNTDDGAILISVTGPDSVSDVTSQVPGYTVHARGNKTAFKVAVFGDLGSGPLVTFTVPDVNRAARYTATVVEVANRASVPRGTLGGYGLTVSK